ncbi:MAG: tetratricopeptide repeat protein, partial [candidate division WOR-3 bacterium]
MTGKNFKIKFVMDELAKIVLELVKRFPNPKDFIKAVEDKYLQVPEEKKGDLFLEVGVRLYNFSYFRLAIPVWEKALSYYLKYKNRWGESTSYTNLGAAYYSLGEFHKAIEHHEKALEIFKAIGDKAGESKCYTNLGNVYFSLGEFHKAIEFYNKALEIFKEIEDRAGESACYGNLGIAYDSLWEFHKAIEYHNKALEICKARGDRAGESKCYINLGNAYYFLEDFHKAIEFYNKALEICKAIGNRAGESACYGNLGNAYDSLGEFHKAIYYYNQGLKIVKEIGAIYEEKSCLNNLGWVYLKQEKFLEAKGYFEEGIEKYEEMTRDKLPKDPKERKEFLKRSISLFDGMVITQIKLGNKEKALEYSERGKGRTILDFIIYKGIEREKEEEIKKPLNFEKIKDLANRIGRTIVLFRVTNKETYVFIIKPRNGFEFITVPGFNDERLGEILVKFDGKKPIDGWVYRYYEFRKIVENWKEFVKEKGEKKANEILERVRNNWFNTLKSLYEDLLAKVFEEKRFEKGEKIVIIPNKGLSILPIPACQKEDGRYLIDEYEITYAPNCTLLDLCYRREEKRKSRDSLFAIANPTRDLLFSQMEVEEIEKLFGRKKIYKGTVSVEVLLNKKDNLLNELKEYNIIHLSTHGEYALGSDLNSRLLLGDNEYLALYEIFDKVDIPNSRLVSLSACESGLTSFGDIADESIGLHTG